MRRFRKIVGISFLVLGVLSIGLIAWLTIDDPYATTRGDLIIFTAQGILFVGLGCVIAFLHNGERVGN